MLYGSVGEAAAGYGAEEEAGGWDEIEEAGEDGVREVEAGSGDVLGAGKEEELRPD